MRVMFVGLLLSLVSCVDSIEVKQGAGLTCWWEGYVAFSGRIYLEGDGLDGFQSQLDGDWVLENKTNGLLCRISTSTAAQTSD